MFNFYCNQDYSIDWTTIILSLFSAFIAGGFSVWATKQAHTQNRKLKEDELKLYEKATALSIVEELKVLLDEYQKEFDKSFSELDGKRYLKMQYSITQDFTTVYTQNAGEIGLIKNKELRNFIIKTYTILKKYMEEILIYSNEYSDFEYKRNEFIARAYPNAINTACSNADNEKEINIIKNKITQNDWSWLNSPYLNQKQVLVFVVSDNKKIEDLIYNSEGLKEMYNILKELIKKTYDFANKIYKD